MIVTKSQGSKTSIKGTIKGETEEEEEAREEENLAVPTIPSKKPNIPSKSLLQSSSLRLILAAGNR